MAKQLRFNSSYQTKPTVK